ncbi:tetratricopeptide repeat protein [Streptomyces microflavus]|uniref:Tetratricopeptide repeat protein n=1 Tax=Streptomyces microflavus TaxID=1919 RepID=A0A7H8N0U4_STRMI|nr:tetratricopeptide repeat protein [Streptomyces microflavus]
MGRGPRRLPRRVRRPAGGRTSRDRRPLRALPHHGHTRPRGQRPARPQRSTGPPATPRSRTRPHPAAELAQDTGNIHLQIAAHTELGQVTRRQNRLTEALRHFEDALALSRGFGPGRWEAVEEGNLADLHADLGNHHQAIKRGTRSAGLRRAIGDTDGEACALATVARGCQGTGDHHIALTHARRAVELGRTSIGSHDETLASPLTILATALHHLGHANEALACVREAAQIYTDKGLDSDANALHQQIRTATVPPNSTLPTPR